jgi:hypothetical protein
MTIKNWPHNLVQSASRFIISDFPAFNKYFVDYVIPLTDYNQKPTAPNWRNDTYPPLEGIGMACFGIIKSLNFIFININNCKSGDPNQTFKNIYFHFGLCLDNVDNLTRQILLCQQELGLVDLLNTLSESDDKIHADFLKWIKKYKKSIINYIDEGKPTIYYPPLKTDLLKMIIADDKLYSEFKIHSEQLKQYRNLFTHNPSVDLFSNGIESFTILKSDKHLNRYWSDLREFIQINPSKKIKPSKMISDDFEKTLSILELIWPSFETETKKVFSNIDFPRLFRNYSRSKFYTH